LSLLTGPTARAQESVHALQLKVCAAEGDAAKEIAKNRDRGWSLDRQIALIESLPVPDKEKASDEKLAARIYSPLHFSAKQWKDIAYRTCLETADN
jgi:hypothetical protein